MNESNKALGQYRTVDAYGAAVAEDRLQLISRLMQGTIDRIVTARGNMIRREVGAKGENLGRAIGMIEGLRVSLDHSQGGEISRNLEALYDYMCRRLTEGNLRNEPRMLDEVVELLEEIRSAWDEMRRGLPARPAEPAVAGRTPAASPA